ncbi:MAG: hypothetical protein MSO56_04465 [Clostridiales bacterium]|nr:hypothetical protein [Clostridiales bacterium]
MKRAWTLLERLLHPPKWVLLTLPPIVFAALIYVLRKGKNSMPAYMIYCMSAYCLTIWVLPLPRMFRKAKANIMHWLTGMAFGRNYIGDLVFRGSVGLYSGMATNFFYVVFRIFVGIRYASVWFLTIAIYYLLLAIMRLSLILSYRNRNMKSELRCYRRTAWLLFLLNIPMGGMIVLMVLTDSGYSYPGYVIYLSALYTFYTIILAIVNLVKFRKLGSPILSAAKVLNFVAALMSMLGLQTAMISQFSTEGENFRRLMNAITGGGVWFSVILIAVYMLLHSRKMKEVKSCEPLGK